MTCNTLNQPSIILDKQLAARPVESEGGIGDGRGGGSGCGNGWGWGSGRGSEWGWGYGGGDGERDVVAWECRLD